MFLLLTFVLKGLVFSYDASLKVLIFSFVEGFSKKAIASASSGLFFAYS